MKLILLAATALIAAPVMAQTSGSTGTSSPTTSGAQGSAMSSPTDQTTTPAPADQTSMPASTDTMSTTQQAGTAAPMTTGSATPVGGYQPSTPAMTGTMTPGVQPIFRQAPSPEQAYPAPAPMAEYPICKAGQYDSCRQVEGHSAGKAKRRMRR